MKKQNGFGLIGILLIVGVLALTAGGVVVLPTRLDSAKRAVRQVWEKKVSPTPIPSPTPTPTEQTKMPWEDSVCGNGICEPCENECCNYPCVTDTKSGQLMCPPPTCLGYCPQDCQTTTKQPLTPTTNLKIEQDIYTELRQKGKVLIIVSLKGSTKPVVQETQEERFQENSQILNEVLTELSLSQDEFELVREWPPTAQFGGIVFNETSLNKLNNHPKVKSVQLDRPVPYTGAGGE